MYRWSIATIAGLVFALLLSACEPSTLEACEQDATKRPTVAGVNNALRACREKFSEQERKASAKRSELVAAGWGKATQQPNIGEVSRIIGQPDSASAITCEKLEGEETPPENCTLHSWTDRREPRICVRKTTGEPGGYFAGVTLTTDDHCKWRMITDRNGKVRGWWPEPS